MIGPVRIGTIILAIMAWVIYLNNKRMAPADNGRVHATLMVLLADPVD